MLKLLVSWILSAIALMVPLTCGQPASGVLLGTAKAEAGPARIAEARQAAAIAAVRLARRGIRALSCPRARAASTIAPM